MDLLRLQNALLRSVQTYRGARSPEEHVVQQFGQRLFEALLAGDVRRPYDASTAYASQQGQGVRVRLHIEAPELAALPWEFLYDPLQREYLCFLPDTVIVRYLEVAQPMPPFRVEPPLRVLAMIADPRDQARLDMARERPRLLEALGPLEISLLFVEHRQHQQNHRQCPSAGILILIRVLWLLQYPWPQWFALQQSLLPGLSGDHPSRMRAFMSLAESSRA